MIEDLKNIALTLHIEPTLTVGHAAKIKTILKVLSEFNKSYNNYLEIEFLKNDDFRLIYDKNNKVLDTIKLDLDLLAVDVKFGSFQISMAPNIVVNQPLLFVDDFDIWKNSAFENYKENIVKGDYQSLAYIDKISKVYNDNERTKIYSPLINLISKQDEYKVNVLTIDGKVEKTLVSPQKERLALFIPKASPIVPVADEKTILAYLKITQTEGSNDIKKNKIKEVLYQEEMEYDTYPYRPDTIRYGGYLFLLNNKLDCLVDYSDGQYYIKYPPFNISVWGSSRDEAIDAFSFNFHALYENFVLEDDNALSDAAIVLKNKLIKSVKKIIDEG